MGKIIFWIVVFFVGLFALRMLNVAKARARRPSSRDAKSAQSMVRCVGCGVFLPRPDARETDAGFRCTDPACAGRH